MFHLNYVLRGSTISKNTKKDPHNHSCLVLLFHCQTDFKFDSGKVLLFSEGK